GRTPNRAATPARPTPSRSSRWPTNGRRPRSPPCCAGGAMTPFGKTGNAPDADLGTLSPVRHPLPPRLVADGSEEAARRAEQPPPRGHPGRRGRADRERSHVVRVPGHLGPGPRAGALRPARRAVGPDLRRLPRRVPAAGAGGGPGPVVPAGPGRGGRAAHPPGG